MLQQQLDLESNRTLASLLAEAEAFLRKELGRDPADKQVNEFVLGVLDYAAGGANERKFLAMCGIAVPNPPEDLQYRVREFLIRRVPMGLWRSAEDRETLFPALFRLRARL